MPLQLIVDIEKRKGKVVREKFTVLADV